MGVFLGDHGHIGGSFWLTMDIVGVIFGHHGQIGEGDMDIESGHFG